MNRIERTFQSLRKAGRKALVGYLTAGDPDLKQSEKDIRCALEAGVDILELGVPFSDPTADGPTIQAAGRRALDAGTTVPKVLALVKRLRKDFDQPIVLFGYVNPLFIYGYERLCKDARAAGADGLLVVDLPYEESDALREPCRRHGLCLIPLIAPTTPKARAAKVLKEACGFVYYVMVRGVTGAREALPEDLKQRLADLRACTELPIGVGFGISSGPQAREAAELADAAVVGSALVQAAREGRLAVLVGELRAALR